MIGSVIPVAMPLTAREADSARRALKILEQDAARLEKTLAKRKSPEGQEATRLVILHKRAQIHQLRKYIGNTRPYRPIPRQKPMRLFTEQKPIPPKGSVKNLQRINDERRQQLAQSVTAAPPPKVLAVSQPVPEPVSDIAQAIAIQRIHMNKKSAAEAARINMHNVRQAPTPKPRPKPAPPRPSLTVKDKMKISSLKSRKTYVEKQLKHVQYAIERLNNDGYARMLLARIPALKARMSNPPRTMPMSKQAQWERRHRQVLKRAEHELSTRNIDPRIAATIHPDKKRRVTLSIHGRTLSTYAVTTPLLTKYRQEIQAIDSRLSEYEKKFSGQGFGMAQWTRSKVYGDKQNQTVALKKWAKSHINNMNKMGRVSGRGVELAAAMVRDFDSGNLGNFETGKHRITEMLMFHYSPNTDGRNASAVRSRATRALKALRRNRYTISREGKELIERTISSYEKGQFDGDLNALQEAVFSIGRQHRVTLVESDEVHRPYKYDPGLGAITMVKHHLSRRAEMPELKPMTFRQLQDYKVREETSRFAKDEKDKAFRANAAFAGVFSRTRAAMERLVN